MQYQCILGIDFMKECKLTLDFDQKSLIIPDNQIKQLQKMDKPVEIDLSDTKLGEGQKQKLRNLFNGFKGLFSDQPGLIHVLYHEIDTGDKGPVVSRPYRYDRVKQEIIDYHIEKMLQEGKIRPIQSPYASPVVLTRKNNGLPPDSPEAYRFAIDYRKLNAITKYPRYPLPVIDDLITNIPHTTGMSTLDLKSCYFQLAISPKDIEKTAFITRNGTFAFLRMPFGLFGATPNFQKTIDIILKPVIGRFVSVYMEDVIITSPSFNEHLDHLNQVFTLLRDAELTLNKDKCHIARDKLKYLGLVISKKGIETDHSKVKTITEMKPPKNSKEVSKFLGMAEWYHKFIPQRPTNPSQGSQPIAGPSHQQDSRQDKSPTVASRHEGSGQYNKARETKTTKLRTSLNQQGSREENCFGHIDDSSETLSVLPTPRRLSGGIQIRVYFNQLQKKFGIFKLDKWPVRSFELDTLALVDGMRSITTDTSVWNDPLLFMQESSLAVPIAASNFDAQFPPQRSRHLSSDDAKLNLKLLAAKRAYQGIFYMPNNHTKWPLMTAVNFLHHENPPTWAGVEPATLGADGQRQTNYATQPSLAEL
ncbi:retrovirus-related Pol polyprotein from transposon opus [Trichonephila clavipes]|nr:retrovirus-related Pol polyprotein from transposon opus [Trichonephila clavipes]